MSPDKVAHRLKNNLDFQRGDLWLMFDDGYLDYYQYVSPVLNRYGFFASFFPPVLTTKRELVLDVNKIHFILACVEDKGRILEEIQRAYEDSPLGEGNASFTSIV